VSETRSDQLARDDAHLRSLGILPELQRSLGFLSNFAVAFSYLSVSTGTYALIGLGFWVGGPPFFWSWPIVIVGQLFVALNFAELASHFPVAGSIYQWSKRLSHKTLGWFTGWFYFWAGILTVASVAITVPLVIASILGVDGTQTYGPFNWYAWVGLGLLVVTTIINAFGFRLLVAINNIGVAAEILGLFVFALILLIFFNHQPLSVLTNTFGTEANANGNYFAAFAVAAFMSLFVVYGFDTAGTFAEETVDAGRQAPRGILTAVLASAAIGAIFLLAIILSTPDIPAAIDAASKGASPIADTIHANLGEGFGNVYLAVVLTAVFVCLMAIQGATSRLMFSMGRDRRIPASGVWARVSPRFKTPVAAVIAVGVLGAIPLLVSNSVSVLATGATGVIYLSYFLCNVGVLIARTRGWPHGGQAWFRLGSWGLVVNILGVVYGFVMLVNFALWQNDAFGDFGTAIRVNSNPTIDTLSFLGQPMTGLPAWPIFEVTVGLILIFGAIYYAIAERGRVASPAADVATGEAAIS
jgi:urea carboxylase system permease